MSAIFISHSAKDHAEADAMGDWLEEQGHKSYFIDYDEKSGIRAGTDWEQVLYQRLRQCQAVVALVTPNWLESKWCFAEMIQAREKGKPIFPVKLEFCEFPGLLSGIQSIDLTVDKESGYRRLAAGLKQQGLDPADLFDPDPTRPPYPGFPAFEEADAAVFFGRSAEILSTRETFEGLRRHSRDVPRLVLVLGSSGSGKSSLVRAGLIPRLKKDEKNWLPLRPFRPQDELSPLDALAFAIADTYKDLRLPCDSGLLRRRLRSAQASIPVESGELLNITRELASAADRREATVLVTVDQAEELLNSGPSETGNAFLQFLGASLSAGDRHLMAVATLRSDSLGVFQNQVASLDSAYRLGLEHRPLTVEPIPIERYADLIEGPARLTGLELEDRFVLKLLRDAGQPDSLPLLAFTLRRLYDLHTEGPNANRHAKITIREYEELGGLAGAVQNAAERIFKERPRTTDEINAFREAFIPGLIRFNEDRSYSRRRAFRHELPTGASGLLAGFVDARILVTSADKDGHGTFEIAHEALLRTWPTLVSWLVEDRDKLRQYNALVRGANEWNESGRKSDLLVHRDGRLKDATELISERRFAFLLGSVEQAYLDACVTDQKAREADAQYVRERQLRDAQRLAHEEAKRAQAEAERAQEAEKFAREQKESASKLRRFAWILAAVALAAVAAAMFGFFQRAEAKKETKRAVKAEQDAKNQAASAQAAQTEAERQTQAAIKAEQNAKDQATLASAAENSARAAEKRTSEVASQANVSLARDSQEAGNDAEALAHLAQALRLNPRNYGASALTGAMLTQTIWPLPVVGLMQHDSAINSAQFSPDGQRVVTASYDGTARLWDATSGKQLGESLKHGGPVYSAQFSPDGQRVVTASYDGTARLWDAVTCKPQGEPMRHAEAVYSAQFSPDGKRVVTASADRTARLWNAASGKAIGEPMKHGDGVSSAQFSPDSQRVVTASFDRTAQLWDTSDALILPRAGGKAIGEPMKHEDGVRSAQFSPDGQRVVTASFDKTARLWDAATGKAIGEPMKHENWVNSAQFSPDGQRVVTASQDMTARLWDVASAKQLGEPLKHGSWVVDSAQFSPDGQRVVTACLDGTARLWDVASAKQLGEPMKHENWVNSAQFSPDGQRVVTASDDGTARLWDAASGKAIGEPMKHGGVVSSARFSPDGQRVVTASQDWTARLWDAASGKPLGEPMKHGGMVSSAQFSPDGQRVVTASASFDGTARLWDAASGKAIGEPMKHESEVNFAQFSPDGQRVVTASADGTARLWDTASGKAIGEPMKHERIVLSAQFSPDGQRVVTASDDGTARLWDAASGKPLGAPIKHGDVLSRNLTHFKQADYSAQFSPDGQRVVTASFDETARLWDVPTISHKENAEDLLLLADLAEATGGVALQSSEKPEMSNVLTPEQVKATRDQIAARFATLSSKLNPLQRLLQWSVQGRKSRTISPFSKVTVGEWIENRITEGTLEGLRAAMQVNPVDARLAAHLGWRLAEYAVKSGTDPDEARRARGDADFQTRRALKLASNNDEAKYLRAEVVKLLHLPE